MSVPEGIVAAQTESLLRRVARERDARCRRVLEAADEQAATLLARARAEARARLRQASTEERRAIEQALVARRAALETVRRQQHRHQLRAALDVAWTSLPGALEAAWGDPATRERWCRAAVAEALAAFVSRGPCTVEIDAADDDVAAIATTAVTDRDCTVVRIAGLGAGLRLRSGRASLDATTRGLTASRERIEAELLAAILAIADEGAAG